MNSGGDFGVGRSARLRPSPTSCWTKLLRAAAGRFHFAPLMGEFVRLFAAAPGIGFFLLWIICQYNPPKKQWHRRKTGQWREIPQKLRVEGSTQQKNERGRVRGYGELDLGFTVSIFTGTVLVLPFSIFSTVVIRQAMCFPRKYSTRHFRPGDSGPRS